MVQLRQFWIYTCRNQRWTVETCGHPVNCSTAPRAHSGCKHRASTCSHVCFCVVVTLRPKSFYGKCFWSPTDKQGEAFVLWCLIWCSKRYSWHQMMEKVWGDPCDISKGQMCRKAWWEGRHFLEGGEWPHRRSKEMDVAFLQWWAAGPWQGGSGQGIFH